MNDADAAGLYLHVPFCLSKCIYCDFCSITSLDQIPAWSEAVKREADVCRNLFPEFDSLYVGGGTPSVLPGQLLADLVTHIRRKLPFPPTIEFTVEANPDDITADLLTRYEALGVNRISLGVQSLDDRDLRFLNRRHSVEQALKAAQWIRRRGFADLSIDLMYGLPGQDLKSWLRILERAVELKPEHLSCYQLTIEEGTPLGALQQSGKVRALDDDHAEAFFVATSKQLEQQGYLHYEISNFARSSGHISRHNVKYWRRSPYLGLGPSAHSFDPRVGTRWWNEKDVQAYCRELSRRLLPRAGSETLSPEQERMERLMTGFRIRDGVPIDFLKTAPNHQHVIEQLQNSELVSVTQNRVTPTRRGFLIADSLPLLFSE